MNISVTVSISRSGSNSIKPSCFCVIFLRYLGYARQSNNLLGIPDIENPLNRKERFIIRNNPRIMVELALELYKNNKASLAKSAEIAGLTTIEFKDVLADRCIAREIEGDEIAEIDDKIQEVWG